MMSLRSSAALLCFISGCLSSFAHAITTPNDDVIIQTTSNDSPRISPECSLVMAPSSIPNAGWGVFSMTDREKGDAIVSGDVVIQVGDLNATFFEGMRHLVVEYAWQAAETGGQYEGIHVLSIIPGLGMLANGSPEMGVLPILEPSVDEAGVTRHKSPGAGAFTHYNNYTFHMDRKILPGDEITVNYGPHYFQSRENSIDRENNDNKPQLKRSLESLQEIGYCLDNLKPGPSTIEHAGRGAFATRNIQKGSTVAPVPVLPITKREAMDITRQKQVSPEEIVSVTAQQLLKNYCYGHPKSSVLLFPYAPIVNLINHSQKKPNAKLQWSNPQQQFLTLEQLQEINTKPSASKEGLLLELVAIQDIQEGEEVLLDYGNVWQGAWEEHTKQWEPYPHAYAPAYAMEEAKPVLDTQAEVQASSTPYPPNMVTSCFYPYIQPEEDEKQPAAKAPKNNRNITSAEWAFTPGIFELRYLRPCTVMQRFEIEASDEHVPEEDRDPKNYYYTVVIKNRYGLAPQERVPAGHMHVVTRLPRRAIRFTDKIYTTDQHLPGAFRQEIGLGDEIFPMEWMDMNPSSTSTTAAT